MAKRIPALHCPTCKKAVEHKDPDFPFCSDRCRLLDLGKWASGGYVISSPVSDNVDNSPEIPSSENYDEE